MHVMPDLEVEMQTPAEKFANFDPIDEELLKILLKDRSSDKNIIWATDNYADQGAGFQKNDHIELLKITGENANLVRPRVEKSKIEQDIRIREKAEVFTPAWFCNCQNNLIDHSWFGADNIFNTENEKTWVANRLKIPFPTASDKTWEDYINLTELEITCGEAPYLVSRYDAVTGESIDLNRRIGLLDRKMRVVSENTYDSDEWHKWAKKSFQNVYGYDWQGDNVLLARKNLLLTYVDYYIDRFGKKPEKDELLEYAEIISWNIWQMDGLKFVIPESCKDEMAISDQGSLFVASGVKDKKHPCYGCAKNDPYRHNGIYCKIMDWKENQIVKFVSLLKNKV